MSQKSHKMFTSLGFSPRGVPDSHIKQKLPDDVKHTYIEAVLILSERKTGLEPATFGLGSQRSTS